MSLSIINFEKNHNNKLLCFNFIAVIPPTKEYEKTDKFKITIDTNHFCFAEIIKIERMYLEDIIKNGLNYLDAGLEKKEYINHLRNLYSKKKWWFNENEKDISMNVALFKKITQLKIFDDNEKLIS